MLQFNLVVRFRMSILLILLVNGDKILNEIIKYGNDLVNAAKSLDVDPSKLIDIDTTYTVTQYKEMASIVIVSRLKRI